MSMRCLVPAMLLLGAAPLLAATGLKDAGADRFLKGDLQGAATAWAQVLTETPADEQAKKLLANCLAAEGKQGIANRSYQDGYVSLAQAAALFPERGDLRMLSLNAELEALCPTGDESLRGDLLDARSDMYGVFDVIFAAGTAENLVSPPPPPLSPNAVPPEVQSQFKEGEYVIHTVGYGETLGTVAVKYYGNYDLWKKIWKSNPQLKNPHRLFPGLQLIIPLKKTP